LYSSSSARVCAQACLQPIVDVTDVDDDQICITSVLLTKWTSRLGLSMRDQPSFTAIETIEINVFSSPF
jgi:hypothetical protein